MLERNGISVNFNPKPKIQTPTPVVIRKSEIPKPVIVFQASTIEAWRL